MGSTADRVTVDRKKLLSELKASKAKAEKEAKAKFEKDLAKYEADMLRWAKSNLRAVERNRFHEVARYPPTKPDQPRNPFWGYTDLITLLEQSLDETITLTLAQVKSYDLSRILSKSSS